MRMSTTEVKRANYKKEKYFAWTLPSYQEILVLLKDKRGAEIPGQGRKK